MGAASFPNGIATFSTKRDNTDINFAADINRLQNEVVAIEESLGPLFTQITTLQTQEDQLQSGLTSEVQQEQVDFQNLKDALLYTMTGQWINCAQTWTPGGQLITPTPPVHQPTIINLRPPGPDTDPNSMWNGNGFTLRKSGFWILQGFVTFLTRTDDNNFNLNHNLGLYESALLINGSAWNIGNDRKELTKAEATRVYLNSMNIGWFPAGTTVSLAAEQTSDVAQEVRSCTLSVTCIRQSGTQWTTPLSQSLLQQLSG